MMRGGGGVAVNMVYLLFSTKRCIYLLDSLMSRWGNCMHRRIPSNLTVDQVHESHRANEPMNEVSIVHLPVASIHTKSVRNSGKTVDRG